MIPCKFSVIINDTINKAVPTLELKSDGWNLVHTQSNQMIEPQNIDSADKVEMNAWEIRYLELQYVMNYLKSKNCTIKTYQDTVENNPQIWCEDSKHNIFWVLIDSKNINKENNKEYNIKETIKTCGNYDGYCIEQSVTKGKTKKGIIYRNDLPKISVEKFEQVYTKSRYIDAQYENIAKENIYNLIQESIKNPDLSNCPSRICVFPVPNYPNMLFRTPSAILQNINLIRKDLTLIPIHYKNNIVSKTNFGLPLYHIDVSDSEYAQRGYTTPVDVVFLDSAKTGLSIIRKAEGKPVLDRYRYYFQTFIGQTQHKVDYHQFSKIIEINVKYGRKAVVKTLDALKQNISTIKPGYLCKGSEKFEFQQVSDFCMFYQLYIREYLKTIKDLAELPTEMYKHAIDDILTEDEFVFDFYNPSNIFVDYKNKQFNFIDFIFEKERVENNNLKDQILNFRNALYGVYAENLIQPEDLLYYDEDNETFDKYAKIVTDKINECVPDELKINEIRSH